MSKGDRIQVARQCVALALAVALAACGSEPGPPRIVQERSLRAEAGSASNGLAYAREACASCHAVTPDELHSPVLAAPMFEAIANAPGMTGIALNAWLHTSHSTMPNLVVDPDRIDDLAAYISALRRDHRSEH